METNKEQREDVTANLPKDYEKEQFEEEFHRDVAAAEKKKNEEEKDSIAYKAGVAIGKTVRAGKKTIGVGIGIGKKAHQVLKESKERDLKRAKSERHSTKRTGRSSKKKSARSTKRKTSHPVTVRAVSRPATPLPFSSNPFSNGPFGGEMTKKMEIPFKSSPFSNGPFGGIAKKKSNPFNSPKFGNPFGE